MITKLQEVLEHLEKVSELLEDCDPCHRSRLDLGTHKIYDAVELIEWELNDIEFNKLYLAKGGRVWPGVIE